MRICQVVEEGKGWIGGERGQGVVVCKECLLGESLISHISQLCSGRRHHHVRGRDVGGFLSSRAKDSQHGVQVNHGDTFVPVSFWGVELQVRTHPQPSGIVRPVGDAPYFSHP